MEDFLDTYIQMAAGRFDTGGLKERVYMYIPITCLRGVRWHGYSISSRGG